MSVVKCYVQGGENKKGNHTFATPGRQKESNSGGTLAYRQLAVVAPRVGQNSYKSSGQGIFGQRLSIRLCMYILSIVTDYIWD